MKDKKNEDDVQEDIEITGEDNAEDFDIETAEEGMGDKLKTLRDKLKACEKEKMEHLESVQVAKAEFLNARKRLTEERENDKERMVLQHIEKILPLADSFHMAMNNTEAWNAIDETWRKGVEGIHNQLHGILDGYGIKEINPSGDTFDPEKHEALTNVSTDDESLHGKIISVVQNGFVRTVGGTETLIRPARVTVGEYTK